MSYVCTKCGGGAVEVNKAHPAIDDRFAIGWCVTCTGTPTEAGGPKKTVVLHVDDEDLRRQMAERDQAARERRLVARVRRGDVPKGPKGEAMVAQAELITKRWAERVRPSK